MGRTIDINWAELKNMGNKTADNYTELEKSRQKILEIILSINECWKGKDSTVFINNAGNYMKLLGNETEKLNEWSNYFNKSSNRYKGGVEEGLKKVRDIKMELQVEPRDKFNGVIR